MHPVGRKCFPCQRFCLCYFILMMGEYEIDSPHMDIYLFTMSPEITGAAFDVPAWPPFQFFCSILGLKLGFPEIFTISIVVSFPECEITDAFFFIFILLDSCTGFHTFHVEVSEVTIFFKALDIKIDRSVITHVGVF